MQQVPQSYNTSCKLTKRCRLKPLADYIYPFITSYDPLEYWRVPPCGFVFILLFCFVGYIPCYQPLGSAFVVSMKGWAIKMEQEVTSLRLCLPPVLSVMERAAGICVSVSFASREFSIGMLICMNLHVAVISALFPHVQSISLD